MGYTSRLKEFYNLTAATFSESIHGTELKKASNFNQQHI
jgi:hypothetical protein